MFQTSVHRQQWEIQAHETQEDMFLYEARQGKRDKQAGAKMGLLEAWNMLDYDTQSTFFPGGYRPTYTTPPRSSSLGGFILCGKDTTLSNPAPVEEAPPVIVYLLKVIAVDASDPAKGKRSWTVHRRYGQFLEFHERLRRHLSKTKSAVRLPNLPSKSYSSSSSSSVGSVESQFLENRSRGLFQYLTQVVREPSLQSSFALKKFLGEGSARALQTLQGQNGSGPHFLVDPDSARWVVDFTKISGGSKADPAGGGISDVRVGQEITVKGVQSNGLVRLSFTDTDECEQTNDAKVEGIADLDLVQSFESGTPHTSGNVVWVDIYAPNEELSASEEAKGRVLVRVCRKNGGIGGSSSSGVSVGVGKMINSKMKTMSTGQLRVSAVVVWFVALFMYFSPLREVRTVGVAAALMVSAASAFLRARAKATFDVQLCIMKVECEDAVVGEVAQRRKPLTPYQKVAAEAVKIVCTEARRTFARGSGNQDSEWTHFNDLDNIKFSSRKLPSGLACFRAEGQYLDCTPLEALLFLNNSVEYFKCDPNMDFQEKLEEIDGNTNAVHLQFKPVWPASTRGMQFAMISKLVPLVDTHDTHELAKLSRDVTMEQLENNPDLLARLNKGEFALVMGSKSINHPDAARNPKRKGICIGTDHGSGYFIYKDPKDPPGTKGCRFVHIAQIDLQFPSILTDNLISNYTHLMSQARNYLDFMTTHNADARAARAAGAPANDANNDAGGGAAPEASSPATTKVTLEGWDICTGKKLKYQKDVSRSDSPGEILKAVGVPWVFRKVLGSLSGASVAVEVPKEHTAGLFAMTMVESFPPDMMILRVDGEKQERLNPFDKNQQFFSHTKIEKKGTPEVQGSRQWGSDAITSVTTNPTVGSVTTDRRYDLSLFSILSSCLPQAALYSILTTLHTL
jgi:hypothetical protein